MRQDTNKQIQKTKKLIFSSILYFFHIHIKQTQISNINMKFYNVLVMVICLIGFFSMYEVEGNPIIKKIIQQGAKAGKTWVERLKNEKPSDSQPPKRERVLPNEQKQGR